MKLRDYRRDDLEDVLALFYEAVHAIDSKDFTSAQLDAWAPREPDRVLWQDRLSNSSTFVAEHKDRIVGFGNVTLLGLIDTLYVHKDMQKSGVGGALLMRLIAEAKSRGLKTVQADVNATALPFFEKQGFAVRRNLVKTHKDVTFSNYVMEMDIPEDDDKEG